MAANAERIWFISSRRFGFSIKIPAPPNCVSIEMRENLNIRYLSFVRRWPTWSRKLVSCPNLVATDNFVFSE